jgi:hypothetical protein
MYISVMTACLKTSTPSEFLDKKMLIAFGSKYICGKRFGSRTFQKANFVSGFLIHTRGPWYPFLFQF